MKRNIIPNLLKITLVLFLMVNCKKEEKLVLPQLTTVALSNISDTTATSGGNIKSDGGDYVTARGVCWDISQNPTITNLKTTGGTGIGVFSCNISGLSRGTIYHVRAYATNSVGTAYGEDLTFSTFSCPVLTTSLITTITGSTALGGGTITSDGGTPLTGKGVCWGISQNPTIANFKTTNGTGIGAFTSYISGLSQGTVYHIRAYATNSVGTAYGEDLTFTTLSCPIVTSSLITDITGSSAISGGTITSDGGAPVIARGVCWGITANPTINNLKTTDGVGTGVFSSNISGLSQATIYHVRAYATNSLGTAYGEDLTFLTLSCPVVTTSLITDIGKFSATSGGTVTYNGGTPVTGMGVCWSTSENPTTENAKTTEAIGSGTFISTLSNLAEGTIYYIRAYATNSIGTGYGNQLCFGTITEDVDGNVYHTVKIGNQTWMVENLKVTHYRNEDVIPNVANDILWQDLTSGAYSDFNNEIAKGNIYGRLYNGDAVLDSREVCPVGWHIPNSAEFTELQTYIGGVTQGGALKEVGTSHWNSPNTGATNATGFTALPGGHRNAGSDGFVEIGHAATFWQKNISADTSYCWVLTSPSSLFMQTSYHYVNSDALIFGRSIRCIKD